MNGRSSEHSLCAADGRFIPGKVVDHIVPHRGDQALFSDQANWQTLCERCHNRKTALEGEGFVKPMPGERFVITGPPGSGKTTWVKQRARPGDIVFDLDDLAGVVTQMPQWPRPKDATRALLAMRDGLVAWLTDAPVSVHVFVIVTDQQEAQRIAQRINGRVRNLGDGR